MLTVSGEILQISRVTPPSSSDNESWAILCRAINPLGEMQLIRFGPFGGGPWFGPIGMLNLVGVSASYVGGGYYERP